MELLGGVRLRQTPQRARKDDALEVGFGVGVIVATDGPVEEDVRGEALVAAAAFEHEEDGSPLGLTEVAPPFTDQLPPSWVRMVVKASTLVPESKS